MKKIIKIVLIGQPNVGKSLLINALSGADMKVGNFSGVTVEKAQAKMSYKDYELEIIDLPGTYSLEGYSQEEKISKSFIESGEYDVLVNVLDSTNLERNLLLSAQLLEKNKKTILALNMSDEAKKEGIDINYAGMSELLGVDVIGVSAHKKENLPALLDAIISVFEAGKRANKRIFSDEIENEISLLKDFLEQKDDENIKALNLSLQEISILLLKGENELYQKLHNKAIWLELAPLLNEAKNRLYVQFETKSIKHIFASELNAFANGICAECVKYTKTAKTAHKADKILMNRFLGIPIFLFFMWVIFQLTFSLGQYPMDWIESGVSALQESVKTIINEEKNPEFVSLISDGIIGGVGAVLSFLPNIVILFFGISLLETTGYMARVAYLLDGIFHRFGLHGKSFIAIVTGFGCSVPAFMAARTLKNPKDRLLTLFVTPFAQCGAKLPVFVLFCSAFAPEDQAGNWLFYIYIFGALMGLVCAKILRLTAFRGVDEPFVMELPKYRMPNWSLVWFSIYNKAKMYIKKAGTFILAASVLIWWAQTYPYNEQIRADFDSKIELAASDEAKDELETTKQNYLLEHSYLGTLGRFISPIFAPLGFEWRESVSLLTGLAAKEVVVATMGVLYSAGTELDETSTALSAKLKEAMSEQTALAFILFAMFYNPCLAATMVFRREAGGWRYVAWLFIFTFVVAYICAFGGILAYKFFT